MGAPPGSLGELRLAAICTSELFQCLAVGFQTSPDGDPAISTALANELECHAVDHRPRGDQAQNGGSLGAVTARYGGAVPA